jgi:hypothetical protein
VKDLGASRRTYQRTASAPPSPLFSRRPSSLLVALQHSPCVLHGHRYINSLTADDSVLVIGCSREPWLADEKALKYVVPLCFPVLVSPHTEVSRRCRRRRYSSLVLLSLFLPLCHEPHVVVLVGVGGCFFKTKFRGTRGAIPINQTPPPPTTPSLCLSTTGSALSASCTFHSRTTLRFFSCGPKLLRSS